MRTLSGYILTFILIPILSLLLFHLNKEWQAILPIQTFLNENINVEELTLATRSIITAGDGTTISEISNDERRIYLPSEEIPQLLKDTFVTVEDRHFFNHHGIDLIATGRAILQNAKHEQVEQGGSSITQQLAKNLYLTQDKTYNRKLTELLYAYQLERYYDKEKILELYINAIYYGNGSYGIEAAAQKYFNKTTNSLSDGELLFLAAIPNNPTLYDPLKQFNSTKERQERMIDQLTEQGKLTTEQSTTIKNQTISVQSVKPPDLYPDYVTYVEKELRQLVSETDGFTVQLNNPNAAVANKAEKDLEEKIKNLLESGITIHTALDKQIQDKARTTINESLSDTTIEAATVVIHHHTHELVSLIGAKDYKKYSFHRGYQSYRQPGSAIKPLLIYAPYIDLTNASLNDLISSNSFCSNGYCPDNYGGATYGNVTIKKAFANSYNTPAVRILDESGITNSFAYLEQLSFSKVSIEDYQLSAALGGFKYGMSPLELTTAYTTFQDGYFQPARAIRKVTDKEGKILYQWNVDQRVRIWNPTTVAKMKGLLESVIKEGTAKNAAYQTNESIGGKTGTTNEVKDLWFIGYNQNYTTGVWIGKDKPQNIQYIGQPHLTIWKNIMKEY